MDAIYQQGKRAKEAAAVLAPLSTSIKNEAIQKMAEQLELDSDKILSANKKDLEEGEKKGFSSTLLDRLRLSEERIKDMAEGMRQIVELPDPVGEEIESWTQPNGLDIQNIRVPIGVIGMIYEARPNVTVDASALSLKTGNAVLLRGSSSAFSSNQAIVSSLHSALEKSGLPKEAVQLVQDTSREAASTMFTMNEYLDVLIPRGGANLIQTVVKQASVPVLETGVGNCHIYIDETAEKDMALSIAINAKTQRPSVCNAAETILVHDKWAKDHLSHLLHALQDKDVTIRGDANVRKYDSAVAEATEKDWDTEYLDLTVSMKIVDSAEEAIIHIKKHGTSHSEAIISETRENVESFFANVDAAALYHNASTRFTDGFEFGFGAEIGISTQKLHARGPMGLKALTSTKYLIKGNGQIKG
ncbi:glutamate-5-semialdehyde dehydrogenase [Bacillus sp. FJAT-44742]|uniref:glutamate-5-semialdehyde dehydrogenase n=1 Tax=Bacillus sp. FJAT-44742 TaxID=2014005 RepID=UPI000C2394FE|nr:glutamate-5-semialdehyde dehydrogenase [Bacillus sp. FJAT-44742]